MKFTYLVAALASAVLIVATPAAAQGKLNVMTTTEEATQETTQAPAIDMDALMTFVGLRFWSAHRS